jgi:transposase
MNPPADLDDRSPERLLALAAQLLAKIHANSLDVPKKRQGGGELERELHCRQVRIDRLSHEVSVLGHQQLGRRSEQLNKK